MENDIFAESEAEGLVHLDIDCIKKAHDDYAALTIQRIFRCSSKIIIQSEVNKFAKWRNVGWDIQKRIVQTFTF